MYNIKTLPKIDLHCHLDGSVRPSTIVDIAIKDSIKLPSYDINVISKLVKVDENTTSLNDYLTKFEIPIKVMQNEESLERIAFEVYEDAALENIKYMEVRFAPVFHTKNGLSLNKIISSVLKGIKRAECTYPIKGNLILTCLRNMPQEAGYEVIEAGRTFLNNGVVAVDLAGPEYEGFAIDYKCLIDKARSYGYKVTIHAGESASYQNVIDAICLLHANRIGHGVNIRYSKYAREFVKSNNITLEMCPTSNLQTKSVDNICNYPLYDFYKEGLLVTINTDNRTVSDASMTEEISLIFCNFNLNIWDYKNIYLNSVEGAFCNDRIKRWLKCLI